MMVWGRVVRGLVLFFVMFSCVTHGSKPEPEPVPWQTFPETLPKKCVIKQISSEPYIICIENFVTKKEVAHLKKMAKPRLKQSLVVGPDNSEFVSPNRTSRSAFLDTVSSPVINSIKQRAARFVHADINSIENLQIVHYKDKQRYDPHYDYFDRSLATAKEVIGKRGQRSATFLVYLNDVKPNNGGETLFPKVAGGLKITPKKYMAVFWFNVKPDGKEDDRTLHGGLPVIAGDKWAINIWIRNPKLT